MSDADWSDPESTYYTDTSLLDAATNTEPENTTKQTNSEAQTLKNTGQTTASQDRYNNSECDNNETKSTTAKPNQIGPAAKQSVFTPAEDSEKDYDSDDSTLDATFKPNRKDINSSDSENQTLPNQSERESESDEDSIPLSKLIKNSLRDKGWKRKGKKVKTNRTNKRNKTVLKPSLNEKLNAAKKRTARRKIQLPPRSTKPLLKTRKSAPFVRTVHNSNGDIERAKSASRKENNLLNFLKKLHNTRLNNLLASNGLTRHEVKADGNCLMKAVCIQLEETVSPEQLRSTVSEHLLEHKQHYMNFLQFPESADESQKNELFSKSVDELKQDGKWNTELGDCLPLAISNKLQRPIRIYSSKLSNPVYDIEPDISLQRGETLLLALLAVHGTEHFDAVRNASANLDDNVSVSNASTEKQTPEKTKTNEDNCVFTPHKSANYISPEKKQLSRKRKSNQDEWKRNKNKKRRCAGEEYISSSGKKVPKRTLKPIDCSGCKFKCSMKISEEQRQSLFDTYWGKENYALQREFICQNITVSDVKRSSSTQRRRAISAKFSFKIEQSTIRVCKSFFLRTLDIGKKIVNYALKKQQHGTFQGTDLRGKKPSKNKTSEETVNFVREHIESFPTVESHYTRKTSKRQYLNGDLNITKMYTMYKEKCKTEKRTHVSEKVYRNIFCENYNYSFHKPKKDQCSFCTLYLQHKMNGTLTPEMENDYKEHLKRKDEARDEKGRDKKRAREDKSFHSCTFDLEAVLSTPCSLVGEFYYKRKLSCYNLTFYSLGDRKGICYLWDESQGGRGSSEIGSCLLMYISRLSGHTSAIKEITFYSDSCGGQNRNQFVSSALVYAINVNSKIEIINQKFFERGHSEMEADSMHSAIEQAKKCTSIFVPSQWATVINMARKRDPYIVIPLKYDQFKDLKKLRKDQCNNMKVDVNGKSVNWLKVKWLQYRKTDPDSVFVNYTYDKNCFTEMKVKTKPKRGKKGLQISSLYESKLRVSQAKKNDLMSLCKSGCIPEEHHLYYEGLLGDQTVHDTVDDDLDADTDSD